ncbi:uncharacterized protein LOC127130771 [Lathyrus oleraceus]|uniref:uncharacterized protein LOC127130771 n=1 Tax=Pisum sativum TaxID=3888 RepID=UPI0021D17FCA|nr:uncharacterized protein LOC127130771 [Pisum sativum]
MLDASSGGALLSKSYEEGYKSIKSITTNTYQWPVSRDIPTLSQKKPNGVHEVAETTALASQIAQLNQMMKNMMTSSVMQVAEPVKVMTDTSEVVCVYCIGSHLFEDNYDNPVSINYVGNNKYNNPYSNTNNPGWHNHPNISWSNNQNQSKPQASQTPQIPPGFSTPNYVVANKGNNRLENILKSFIQETKLKFQSQGVSIKNLENQVGKITTALSSINMGALSSSIETPATTSGINNVETCKLIILRSGKECEGTTSTRNKVPTKELSVLHRSGKKKADVSEELSSEEGNEEILIPEIAMLKTIRITSNPEKKPSCMLEVDKVPRFTQERPQPPFPQRIRKAKEEQQFSKFMEILKQLHINISLIDYIQQMPN